MASDDAITRIKRDVGDGWARVARGSVRGEAVLLPGGSLGIAGEPFPEMNWGDTYGSGAVEAFRAFVGRLRARGLAGVISATPEVAENVGRVAAELGLGADGGAAPFMVCRRDDARLAEVHHEVVRVTDPSDLAPLGDVIGDAFDCPAAWCRDLLGPGFLTTPDLDVFAARADGEMVGAACTVRVGTTVGVYAVATRSSVQRQGVGASVLSAAMAHHLERGSAAFGLHASAEGLGLYERLGFVVLFEAPVWSVDKA